MDGKLPDASMCRLTRHLRFHRPVRGSWVQRLGDCGDFSFL